MKQFRVVILLVIISVILLIIQLLILHTLIYEEDKEHHTTDSVWQLVHDIVWLTGRNGIPLFLIDPLVLQKIESYNGTSAVSCQLICFNQKVTYLATFSQFAGELEKASFREDLQDHGYSVALSNGLNPSLLRHGFQVNIPLHVIVSSKHHTFLVLIIIFQERSGNFWWHGKLGFSSEQLNKWGISQDKLNYSNQEAAYEKVEIVAAHVDGIKVQVPVNPSVFLQSPKDVAFIECNYDRARKFQETYGKDTSPEAQLFQQSAKKLLVKAKEILDGLGVPFWLSSGTCLGFFRECDIISYSKDVDLGIWIKDYRPEIIPEFSTNNIPLTHQFGKVEDSFELSFQDKDIKLDIFFFYEETNYVWNGGTQARTGKKFKYIFPKFTLCWTEFLNLKVRVPCQTKDYILANYGSNWFEPVKIWDWKKSPPNVQENGKWPLEDWPEVIQLLPLLGEN
ncbi:ribitol-5-phosphate transferase FKTN-like isoform X2 [Tachypleus tridentatus]|uniref:ribitol-5-phosphate transferase FKTN-like isoform X2 n=1 Tax=Tachypleus tridentatus TaxID=6853 RepID=UPI003FD5636B